jgi:hypothetical protein
MQIYRKYFRNVKIYPSHPVPGGYISLTKVLKSPAFVRADLLYKAFKSILRINNT